MFLYPKPSRSSSQAYYESPKNNQPKLAILRLPMSVFTSDKKYCPHPTKSDS